MELLAIYLFVAFMTFNWAWISQLKSDTESFAFALWWPFHFVKFVFKSLKDLITR